MNESVEQPPCPTGCPCTAEQLRPIFDPSRFSKWLMMLPPIMIVVLPLIGGATAWVSSRVDAANAAQEQEMRRNYVEGRAYEGDRKTDTYLRDQLDKRLERMDKKLDALLERKK